MERRNSWIRARRSCVSGGLWPSRRGTTVFKHLAGMSIPGGGDGPIRCDTSCIAVYWAAFLNFFPRESLPLGVTEVSPGVSTKLLLSHSKLLLCPGFDVLHAWCSTCLHVVVGKRCQIFNTKNTLFWVTLRIEWLKRELLGFWFFGKTVRMRTDSLTDSSEWRIFLAKINVFSPYVLHIISTISYTIFTPHQFACIFSIQIRVTFGKYFLNQVPTSNIQFLNRVLRVSTGSRRYSKTRGKSCLRRFS